MKPTVQFSQRTRHGEPRPSITTAFQNSPATDWSYQTPAGDLGTAAKSFGASPAANGFRGLSRSFLEAESKLSYRIEAVLFGVIVALAAWPMVLAAQAAMGLAR